MGEISTRSDISETRKSEAKGYKDIKPEGNISTDESKKFCNALFKEVADDNELEKKEEDTVECDIKITLKNYFKDLKDKSECSETIQDKPFDASDLKKVTAEKNAEMRDEFDDKKIRLKREWEKVNGRPWPKYEQDVYSPKGKLIRRAGNDYDAHHIQPLCMGGKNEVGNITPLNATVHYDKLGVHAPDSPYSQLDQILGGING